MYLLGFQLFACLLFIDFQFLSICSLQKLSLSGTITCTDDDVMCTMLDMMMMMTITMMRSEFYPLLAGDVMLIEKCILQEKILWPCSLLFCISVRWWGCWEKEGEWQKWEAIAETEEEIRLDKKDQIFQTNSIWIFLTISILQGNFLKLWIVMRRRISLNDAAHWRERKEVAG